MTFRKVTKNNITKAALFFLLLSTPCAHAAIFSVIYIEAAEGNSSGGHIAAQLGETVFHYQYDDGFIRLFKNNARQFRQDYQYRQNRNLHVADIEVSPEVFEQLESHFKLQFFSQKQQQKRLESLQQDQWLLQALLNQNIPAHNQLPNNEPPPLQLAGAGLFFRDESKSLEQSPAAFTCNTLVASAKMMADLKRRLTSQYGAGFLTEKSLAIKNQLDALTPAVKNIDTSSYQYSFSEEYGDLLTGMMALSAIQNSLPLTAHACFHLKGTPFHLDDEAVNQAENLKNNYFHTALKLLTSDRPDWGYALFVTLGRLITLEDAIQRRHWTFLVDEEDNAEPILINKSASYPEHRRNERRADQENLYRNTQAITTENRYNALELAANRYHHWLESDLTNRLKYRSELPLPRQSISALRFLTTNRSKEQLAAGLSARKTALKNLEQKDGQNNHYDLLTNNCASKLIFHLNQAVYGDSASAFGGYIDPQINFIPFQAFDAVLSTYRVKAIHEMPAYRQEKLANLYKQGSQSLVYLRESNIFSASLYHYNPEDAWFVFFTDDAVLPRPLFGVFNTAAGFSQSLFGFLNWPFDGGKELKTGMRGVLASLPELAFFNIRKGSYPFPLNH